VLKQGSGTYVANTYVVVLVFNLDENVVNSDGRKLIE
jgi:hypothetical protein